ncbi:energy transducer TonB [Novispirillum sp. DQ9]|uniref:energy transducer TonB n=1 Tax=Novispirillum sp. DQ9 TaxID=3398612 RepID=UPI003C7A817D
MRTTAPATTATGGTTGPWLAALALHGGIAGLLALGSPAAPPQPVPVEPMVVVMVDLIPAPAPAPTLAPAPVVAPPPAPVPPAASPAPPAEAAPVAAAAPRPAPAARPTPAPAPTGAAAASTEAAAEPTAEAAARGTPAATPTAPAPPAETAVGWDDAALGNAVPAYPRSARLAGQEGRVVLRVRVSAAGAAESVHVVTSSGADALDAAATRAVRGWRFRPATRGGAAVSGEVEVPVVFRLRG